jgi:hypothetical protein
MDWRRSGDGAGGGDKFGDTEGDEERGDEEDEQHGDSLLSLYAPYSVTRAKFFHLFVNS